VPYVGVKNRKFSYYTCTWCSTEADLPKFSQNLPYKKIIEALTIKLSC